MRLLRLSLPSLFLWLKGWHAPAGRRSVKPRPLAQARQIGPAAPVGALNDQDPADGPVSGQPSYGVRPDNRSDRVPAPTLRPYPRKPAEAGPEALTHILPADYAVSHSAGL